jgi:hypothetical protein
MCWNTQEKKFSSDSPDSNRLGRNESATGSTEQKGLQKHVDQLDTLIQFWENASVMAAIAKELKP